MLLTTTETWKVWPRSMSAGAVIDVTDSVAGNCTADAAEVACADATATPVLTSVPVARVVNASVPVAEPSSR